MEITDKRVKKAILSVLTDDEMIRIFNSTKNEAKSVATIMKINDISHSTAYRKIKWMLENELLVVVKMNFTDDGKKYSLFKSTIRSVNVKYQKNQVTVESNKNVDPIENATENFFSLGDSNE